jgi:hypothetical protein
MSKKVERELHGPARRWVAAAESETAATCEVVEVRPGDDPDEAFRRVLPELAARLREAQGPGVLVATVGWAPLDRSFYWVRRVAEDRAEVVGPAGVVGAEILRDEDGRWRLDADGAEWRGTLAEAGRDGVQAMLEIATRAPAN